MSKDIYSVGIAGAGIGGLTLAILLKQRGHAPEIFEQFDRPRPVGSGLVIQPVGQTVLAELGVAEKLLALGSPIHRMLGRNAATGRRVLDVWYDRSETPREFGLAVQRPAVFEALYDRAVELGIPIHSSHPIAGCDGQRFLFETGQSSDQFDLLVDASGARSNLSPLTQKLLPFGALWATVDWVETDAFRTDMLSQRYLSARHMFGVMPSGKTNSNATQTATIFWSLPQDRYDHWKKAGLDIWQQEAKQLWPEAAPFIDQITSADQFTMARYSHGTLRRPWEGRLVFIGDSAHRASPQLGQGANMALLDAYALAQALDTHGPDKAGPVYALRRKWHVRCYQWFSWAFTPMYQSRSRVLPWLRDYVFFPAGLIPPVPRILTALVKGTMIDPFKKR